MYHISYHKQRKNAITTLKEVEFLPGDKAKGSPITSEKGMKTECYIAIKVLCRMYKRNAYILYKTIKYAGYSEYNE